MERSLAVTEPDRMESLRSPSLTSRPSTWVRRDSSMGRKLLGSIRKGSARALTSRRAKSAASDESDAFHWRLRVYYLRDSLHMRRTGKILAGALALLLAGCLAAVWLTRDTAPNRAVEQVSVVDRRLLVTARQLLALAETTQEVELARQAARLADHELDQAFATAVREAADFKPAKSGPVQQLNEKVSQAKARIAARRERIAKLEKDAPASDQAAGNWNWRRRNWRWTRTSWKTRNWTSRGRAATSGASWSRRHRSIPRLKMNLPPRRGRPR